MGHQHIGARARILAPLGHLDLQRRRGVLGVVRGAGASAMSRRRHCSATMPRTRPSAADKTGDTVRDAGHAIKEAGSDAADKVRDTARDAKRKID